MSLAGPIEEALGYDLRGLMIGSEGTFGIVTKAIVRLTRNPQAYYTMLVDLKRLMMLLVRYQT